MGGEPWQETTLGKVVTLQRGHDLPDHTRSAGSVPVVGSFGVTGWHDKARARGPGVTVGRSGASFGVVSYVTEDFWPLNTALYVIDFHGNDPRFCYYLLKEFDFRRFNSGSAQPSLNRNFVHPAPVRVPAPSEQKRIADLLGSLDDKIELNRRMVQTLEEVARALFRSWFIDFDPVRAKMGGLNLALPADIAGLFPDRCGDDGLPEGWSSESLYLFSNVIYGAPFASNRFNTEGVGLPLIRVRDLGTHDPAIFTDETHPKGHIIEAGDIVVGMDGEFRCHVWKGPRAYLNQRVCHFEPVSGVPSSYIGLALEAPLARFEAGAVGTTVIHLGKKDLDRVEFVQPGIAVLAAFDEVCAPMIARSVSAAAESRTLASLRDTLLPKLVAGELRIPDAEALIKEAA